MEYIDDKNRSILQKYLKKISNSDNDEKSDEYNDEYNDEEIVYDKETYTKFYDLLNNISLFFIVNTFETICKNLDNFNLNDANALIKNSTNIIDTFKLQLNIIWSEFDDYKNNDDKLIIDFKDLLYLNIIKHKYCLFTFIKANVLSLIKELCKLQFSDDVKNKNELIEKIAKFSNAVLVVNKFTGLEDEDEFECIDCNDQSCIDVFWK